MLDTERIKILEEKVAHLQEQMTQFIQGKAPIAGSRMTTKQAAEYLGMTYAGLRRLTSKKLVPFYKPSGKQLYFLKQELDQWLIDSKSVPRK